PDAQGAVPGFRQLIAADQRVTGQLLQGAIIEPRAAGVIAAAHPAVKGLYRDFMTRAPGVAQRAGNVALVVAVGIRVVCERAWQRCVETATFGVAAAHGV